MEYINKKIKIDRRSNNVTRPFAPYDIRTYLDFEANMANTLN